LGWWNVAIIEGLISEECYAEKADSCQYGEEPKAPVPFCGREDESCKEGPEVRGQDYKSGPNIDFAAR
jgi:hypothetical protein